LSLLLSMRRQVLFSLATTDQWEKHPPRRRNSRSTRFYDIIDDRGVAVGRPFLGILQDLRTKRASQSPGCPLRFSQALENRSSFPQTLPSSLLADFSGVTASSSSHRPRNRGGNRPADSHNRDIRLRSMAAGKARDPAGRGWGRRGKDPAPAVPPLVHSPGSP